MMRSASTLQYNLVCEMVESTFSGRREGFYWKNELESKLGDLSRWSEDGSIHVIKTHWLPSRLLGEHPAVRVCYTYRNLLDVALSLKRLRSKSVSSEENWQAIIHHLDEAVSTYYALKQHPDVVWQRYEEILNDQRAAAQELARTLGLPVSEAMLETVSKKWHVEETEQKAARLMRNYRLKRSLLRILNRLHAIRITTQLIQRVDPRFTWELDADRRTLLRPDHISVTRGAVGVWESGLEETEIAMLNNRYRFWFADAGYLTDSAKQAERA
jgi:hypothetical protein